MAIVFGFFDSDCGAQEWCSEFELTYRRAVRPSAHLTHRCIRVPAGFRLENGPETSLLLALASRVALQLVYHPVSHVSSLFSPLPHCFSQYDTLLYD
jgi:hypothetical protein